jgi:transcription termination factor Rho
MLRVDAVNGVDTDTARRRPVFNDLTPVHPDELINLETDPKNLSQRLINLVNPLGKGQRALIVSPPKAGKTMLLKQIANGVSANYPEILLMVALIGERPRKSRTCAAASRARSSPRPSTSRQRTTPMWPRWPSRSPSARSRPAATS